MNIFNTDQIVIWVVFEWERICQQSRDKNAGTWVGERNDKRMWKVKKWWWERNWQWSLAETPLAHVSCKMQVIVEGQEGNKLCLAMSDSRHQMPRQEVKSTEGMRISTSFIPQHCWMKLTVGRFAFFCIINLKRDLKKAVFSHNNVRNNRSYFFTDISQH